MVSLAGVSMLVAGCSGGATDEFGEGRELVAVHHVARVPFDDTRAAAEQAAMEWATVLDVRLALLEEQPRAASLVYSGGEDSGFSFRYNSTRSWGYARAGWGGPKPCRPCGLVPFGRDEAVRRVNEYLSEAGYDPEVDFTVTGISEFNGDGASAIDGEDVREIYVDLMQNHEGIPTGLDWSFLFADSDGELVSASGHWGVEIEKVGDAPLLTPAEALAADGPTASSDPALVDEAVLTAVVELDRESETWWLLPAYSYPIDSDLGITFTALAVRPQDLPDPPPASEN